MPRHGEDRRVAVVAHTHWDREWYGTFEQFRMRLVRLMDHLLDILESEPDYLSFLLDAQTVVLEDYLAVRPQNRERLERQLFAGRIEVGPWYVQPDEALVSGESLVRNLLLGRHLAGVHQAAGGGLRVGYLPDIFGHIAQMPQVLRGFGIDNAVLWRGVSALPTQEFRWRSPDGSEVFVVHLPDRTGYSMVHRLATTPAEALRQIEGLYADLDPGASTSYRLLLVGVDHIEPQRGLPQLLYEVSRLPGAPQELCQDGLGSYLERLRSLLVRQGGLPAELYGVQGECSGVDGQSSMSALPVLEGELRDTNRAARGVMNFLLPNILSSRMPLKVRNREVERELLIWAEPLSAFAQLAGDPPASDFLRRAWSYLLQNHPHDSICGCSLDQVHKHMLARFDSAFEIAGQVVEEKAARLASLVDTSELAEDGRVIMLVNPTAYPRSEVVDVTVDLRPERWRDIEVVGTDGQRVGAQVLEHRTALRARSVPDPELFSVVVSNPNAAPAPDSGWLTAFDSVEEVRLRFWAEVPACGYATYVLRPASRGRVNRGSLRIGPFACENGRLRLTVDSSGTVSLTDLTTGRTWPNCLQLEDAGDGGDGYTYSPPQHDRLYSWRPCSVSVVEDGPVATTLAVEGDFMLPAGLDSSRRRRSEVLVACPVRIDLTLSVGSPLLDVHVRFTNWAKDHRLRLVVPTGIPARWSVAESQWAVVRRPTHAIEPDPEVWIEDAPVCHPTCGFVDVPDEGGGGFAAFGFGLPEYEVTEGGVIYLTLLRCFGHLGSPDPLTIRAGAGPGLPTPDAQMLGATLELRTALLPHDANADLWRLSRQWQNPCRAFAQSRHPGTAPLSGSWITVPTGADISSIKEAEDGGGVVVRLFNPGDRPLVGSVRIVGGASTASLVAMDESSTQGPLDDGKVRIAPWQVVSLRFVPPPG